MGRVMKIGEGVRTICPGPNVESEEFLEAKVMKGGGTSREGFLPRQRGVGRKAETLLLMNTCLGRPNLEVATAESSMACIASVHPWSIPY